MYPTNSAVGKTIGTRIAMKMDLVTEPSRHMQLDLGQSIKVSQLHLRKSGHIPVDSTFRS